MPREITQEYSINLNLKAVFDALISPAMIKKWWFANSAIVLPEEGGVYAVTWGEDIDNPDYISIANIASFDPPFRLLLTDFKYKSKEGGLPFEADMETEFRIEDFGAEKSIDCINDLINRRHNP
jgi:uncharacterized protein YndB with AHSA1/START domain